MLFLGVQLAVAWRTRWSGGRGSLGKGVSGTRLLSFSCVQKPGGLMFPDRAALYVVAIEDRQYKDFKIHCE